MSGPRRTAAHALLLLALGRCGWAATCQEGQDCLAAGVDDVGLLQVHRAAPVSGGREFTGREFTIKDDAFMKDGEKFIIRSGSVHYPRIPRAYWRDRFQRVKALGLNTVTVYAFWNYHEETEGEFDFTGQKDIVEFLTIAHEEGLLVILRPGPYICGEWDGGGLPWWLLTKPGIKLRTWESQYIAAVDRFWDELLPKVQPLLYSNGGPIVIVQIENEYGSYGNCATNPDDARYMYHLLDVAVAHLGKDIVYTTIDGGEGPSPAKLEQGSPWRRNASVCATVDGGLSPSALVYRQGFVNQKEFNAPGHSPQMWSELWTGWFSFWGGWAANKTAHEFYAGVGNMVQLGASFSIYMAHGGTNFATWSGANQIQSGDSFHGYEPDITSYDYSAPISEQGRHNVGQDGGDLFDAIRRAIAGTYGPPQAEDPAPIPRKGYGEIRLTHAASLFENLDLLQTCNEEVAEGEAFPTMESLGLGKGLILYRFVGEVQAQGITFQHSDVKDRLQVFVDQAEVGWAYRATQSNTTVMQVPMGQSLDLLVENMGHINYGYNIDEQKGLMGKPPRSLRTEKWAAVCLPLDYDGQVGALHFRPCQKAAEGRGPMFQRGILKIVGTPQDTYLDTRGFVKGYVWVNGHLLGRYWESRGAQHTLYLPAPFLRQGANEVIVLDLHGGAGAISSVEYPRWLPASSTGLELS